MIRIFEDADTLSHATAELITDQALAAVRDRGGFALVCAGGSTPRRTYEMLAGGTFRHRLPWRAIDIFWGDERCVAPTDPRSNARMARRALLQHVPIPRDQIHPLYPEEGDPPAAAERYSALLREYAGGLPAFDLVLLGLGSDGHTASLFPGSPALAEPGGWVAVTRAPRPEPFERLTLTLPVLNAARMICFLVAGPRKAAVLRAVLHPAPGREPLPAQLVQPANGVLVWHVDRAAAAELPEGGISA